MAKVKRKAAALRSKTSVPKAKITVKNRRGKKISASVSEGADGGGQTGFFEIPDDDTETWKRFSPSRIRIKIKDSRVFYDERFDLTIDQTFTVTKEEVLAKPPID
jgi:hypothetical protein